MSKDVREILTEWLTGNGYDGLTCDACGCGLNDLCPCGVS